MIKETNVIVKDAPLLVDITGNPLSSKGMKESALVDGSGKVIKKTKVNHRLEAMAKKWVATAKRKSRGKNKNFISIKEIKGDWYGIQEKISK